MTAPLLHRVALVTGAASGIGRATALTLAEAGATVAAVDRDTDGLAGLVTEAGTSISPFPADLRDIPSLPAIVADLIDRLGRIDMVGPARELHPPGGRVANLLRVPVAGSEVQRSVAVHVTQHA